MQKMRFFRRCLPLFLAFWLLLAVAGAPFAAYAGESVTVRDSSGQVRYAAPMDPENACPALQSALDTVRSGAYGTCTVTVTPGEYRMTKSAVLASDMTLNLTGVTLLNANAGKGNIFISPNRDRTGKDYTGYSALKNCTLQGGTLDYAPGNTNGSCLLRLAHCKNVTVDGTAFLNNADSHHAELAAGYNVRFVNCLFSGQTNQTESSAEALQIDILEKNRHFANFPAYDGTMNQKITVEDCTFQNLICGVGTRNAFAGRYQKGITIRGNTFRRLQGTAIVCTNYVDAVIEKNTITDCGRGVAYYMCKNSGVTDVFTDGSGKVLGKRNTDCGSRITDNTISVCQTAEMDKPRGMFLYGGRATGKMPAGNYAVYNLTVSGNTITTTGGGITGTDLQNCTLADNRITHTGAAAETTVGILLHGSSGNLIEKNTCTALHNGLKCMDASHSNELRSNTVTNSRSSAVCIVDSNGVEVTENTIRTGATNGIFVQRSKKARLLRNTIQAMGHNGICLAEKSTAATGSNRISGCRRYGMSSQPGTALTTVGDRLTGNTKGQGIAQGSKNMKFSTIGSTRLVGGRIRRGKNKGKIALQWKAVPGAKQYVLYRRDGSIRGKYRRLVTLTGTRYIDTAPKRGKNAAYRLVAQTKTNGVTAESPVARAAVRIKG